MASISAPQIFKKDILAIDHISLSAYTALNCQNTEWCKLQQKLEDQNIAQ